MQSSNINPPPTPMDHKPVPDPDDPPVEQLFLDINLVLVGDEDFTDTDKKNLASAMSFARGIYNKLDPRLRIRVQTHGISKSRAQSYTVIDSSAEAQDLTELITIENDRMDVFVVRVMNGADGWSPINGVCGRENKKKKEMWTGCVVSLNGTVDNIGNTIAHEMGHYLGLDHLNEAGSFIRSNSNSNTGIHQWQGNVMYKHCNVHVN